MSTQEPPTPIRFRCSQCNKALKVAPAKAGRVIACPACSAELIVPDAPVDAASNPVAAGPPDEATGGSPLGFLNLRLDETSAPAAAAAPITAAAPALALAPAPALADSESPLDFLRVGATVPASAAPAGTVSPTPSAAPLILPPVGVEVAPSGPIFPGIHTEPEPSRPVSAATAPLTVADRAGRRNDVVLSRSVVMLWSFLVLLAVVFAFSTGLLAGHFLWRA